MSRIIWNDIDRCVGIDRVVYYPRNGIGEAWNGFSSLTETISDFDLKTRYHDTQRLTSYKNVGCFAGTMEAYSYPNSFYTDVLTKTYPKSFGLSYRTYYGDSYKVHLVYNVLTVPSSFTYRKQTGLYSFPFTTLPIGIPESKATSHIIIDSGNTYETTLGFIEDFLYGSGSIDPKLPTPTEIFNVFEENAILRVIDNGDGSCSITGPDDAVQNLDSTSASITWSTVIQLSSDTYQISSL